MTDNRTDAAFDAIAEQVSTKSGFPVALILSKVRQRLVAHARQEVIYRVYTELGWTMENIADHIGNDHSNISYAIKTHKARLQTNLN